MAQIAPLGRQETLMQMLRLGVIGQKRGETVLRQAKERLILPKRVIGIKADGGDAAGHKRPSCAAFLGGLSPACMPRCKAQTTQPYRTRSAAEGGPLFASQKCVILLPQTETPNPARSGACPP